MCYNFSMRILLIGKNQATRVLADYFTQNQDNIVFSTLNDTSAEFIDIATENIQEIKDFALANEMSLTILCDKETILSSVSTEFREAGLSIFAPEGDAVKFIASKIWAKKFIYKNKIPTPRFQFFEKPQAAVDYIRKNKFPTVIKPDSFGAISTRICETFGGAKNAIEEFFDNGFRKILIEEYSWGKEFTIYAICDGYNPVILCEISKYQNSLAKLGVDFISPEEKEKLINETITPFVNTLSKENGEYIGILGFNFVKNKDKISLISLTPFFKDLDAQLAIQSVNEDWAKLFESAISGTLCIDFKKIKTTQDHILAYEFYENGKKEDICTQARTFNSAKKLLIEEGVNKSEIEEALKFWKY